MAFVMLSTEVPQRSPADAVIVTDPVPALFTVIMVPPVSGSGAKETTVSSDADQVTLLEIPLTTAGTWYSCDGSYAEYIGLKTTSSTLFALVQGVPPPPPPPEVDEHAARPPT